jgi:hypothetical protein
MKVLIFWIFRKYSKSFFLVKVLVIIIKVRCKRDSLLTYLVTIYVIDKFFVFTEMLEGSCDYFKDKL